MGFLRLFLSFFVLLTHTGHWPYGFNTGVAAVAGFFLISGFVMTATCKKYYTEVRSIPKFYADRLLRIYPHFIFYLTMNITIGYGLLFIYHKEYSIDIWGLLANYLLIPQDIFNTIFPHFYFVPQSWSLGLEIEFYLVIPFILIFKWRRVMLLISAIFFLLPYTGIVDSELWGYRELPGTLFIFLTGSYIYTNINDVIPFILSIVWIYTIILFSFMLSSKIYDILWNKEILSSLILFIPVIWCLRFLRDPLIFDFNISGLIV